MMGARMSPGIVRRLYEMDKENFLSYIDLFEYIDGHYLKPIVETSTGLTYHVYNDHIRGRILLYSEIADLDPHEECAAFFRSTVEYGGGLFYSDDEKIYAHVRGLDEFEMLSRFEIPKDTSKAISKVFHPSYLGKIVVAVSNDVCTHFILRQKNTVLKYFDIGPLASPQELIDFENRLLDEAERLALVMQLSDGETPEMLINQKLGSQSFEVTLRLIDNTDRGKRPSNDKTFRILLKDKAFRMGMTPVEK